MVAYPNAVGYKLNEPGLIVLILVHSERMGETRCDWLDHTGRDICESRATHGSCEHRPLVKGDPLAPTWHFDSVSFVLVCDYYSVLSCTA